MAKWRNGAGALARMRFVVPVLLLLAAFCAPARAQNLFTYEPVTVAAQDSDGFGRLIVTFTDRFDLPAYEVEWDNGVLVIDFEEPVNTSVDKLAEEMPDYVSAARLDPDLSGIRIGLREEFRINKTEAGEAIYIDLLPMDWQGVEPGLPPAVVEELSRRSRDAAIKAEQQRKAEYVRTHHPEAAVSVGRHPTFTRLLIDWEIGVKADYEFKSQNGNLDFDWPVQIDLGDLQSALPPELVSISNRVDAAGSHITFEAAEGVEPRFYRNSDREYVVDFDALEPARPEVDIASLLQDQQSPGQQQDDANSGDRRRPVIMDVPEGEGGIRVTPYVEAVGSTVRLVFPFERDTAAAAFRRGNTLWMLFDSYATITAPEAEDELEELASGFTVVPAGDTSIVRLNLETERLATLGAEGRAWVLSLGDNLLTPGELISLTRRQAPGGLFEMVADMDKPYRVHELRDPEVGDVLEVVTAFPPARGIVRELEHVDFTALRSLHGLVVKPLNDRLDIGIEARTAVISAPRGLILSTPQLVRKADGTQEGDAANGYVDLVAYEEPDPERFAAQMQHLMQRASEAEQHELDTARLDIAKLYLANRLFYESLGMLDTLEAERVTRDLKDEVMLLKGAASTMAGRWRDALDILNSEALGGKPDALMWRTIARAGVGDFRGARQDALVAELSIDSYPHWVRERFLMAATQAALEEDDLALANRYLGLVETAALDAELLNRYELLSGRVDQAAGRIEEALDTYGRVIAADIRPLRSEAVYRTMQLLDELGRLDPVRAANTLATEVLVWRGDALEAKMLQLLARLYFRNHDYRNAFDTARALAEVHPENPATGEVLEQARDVFADLYLNGQADIMEPVDALTLYYDYRNLTPTGARGDEMVRNLARRLVSFDLLSQASELLQYQVDSRLEGAARAQIAADLAVVYLAERKPEKALAALNDTQAAGITPGLKRQRRVLEARALIDAGREDLALDILSQLDGRDADLLRVDAHWRAKRYRDASETLERVYAAQSATGPLMQGARMNVIKAAVGFVLAGDRIGLGRLRQRFSDSFAKTPEWPLFDFVTGDVEVTSTEFRKVADEIADTDSLNAFLQTYRDVYGADGALAPQPGASA